MKVAIVLFPHVAIVTVDSHGMQHVTWYHVPHYKVGWQVKDGKYCIDYGQIGARVHDKTRTHWCVALPGCKPIYMTEYKPPIQYKEGYNPVKNTGYTPTHNKETYKPVYKTKYIGPTQQKKEYKSVSKNIGYNTEEYKRNCKKKISFKTQ